ncbi:MAG: hypothetical protein M0P10_05350 [Sphaerochaetaceae bacterium]|nr:hypothetical protein [Sphaerochaetaceae bacterium]
MRKALAHPPFLLVNKQHIFIMILNAVSIFQEASSITQNRDKRAMRGLHKGQQESLNSKQPTSQLLNK